MMQSIIRTATILLTLLAAIAMAAPVQAEFPERNLNWIVQFPPGGGYDAMSRALARSINKQLPKGTSVIVKNVTGAGGRRGAVSLYRAKPDGYTVGVLDMLGLVTAQIQAGAGKTLYDLEKFEYIARMGNEPYTIFVSGKSPHKTLDDLKKADRLTWGSEGIGSGRWLPSFLAARALGLEFELVTGYRGTGDSVPGLMRGDFVTWLNPSEHSTVGPLARDGNLRCIVHLGSKRSWACPDTPTAKESGIDHINEIVRLVAIPPGVPRDRARKLEEIVVKAMDDPDYRNWAKSSGTAINPGDAAASRATYDNLKGMVNREADAIRKALKK